MYTIDAECIEDHDTPRESRRKNPIPDQYRACWTSGLCARPPQAVDVTRLYSPLHLTPAVESQCTAQPAPAHLFHRSLRTYPRLVEHHRGALPGHAVLPVVVSGVHGRAAEHAGDGAGGVRAIVGDATPGRRGADVASVVVSQEGLYAHKLLEVHAAQKHTTTTDVSAHPTRSRIRACQCATGRAAAGLRRRCRCAAAAHGPGYPAGARGFESAVPPPGMPSCAAADRARAHVPSSPGR